MQLQKTAKALEELQPGSRQLPQRARSALLIAGGKTLQQLQQLLGEPHAGLAQQLVDQGYLQLVQVQGAVEAAPSSSAKAEARIESKPAPATATKTVKSSSRPTEPPLAPAPITTSQNKPAPLNLAGTRMYLFDMCERMFANRHEVLAQSLREQLREARDLPTLRCAGLALLSAVSSHAGEERAEFLREKLASLLEQPEEAAIDTIVTV